MSFAFDQLGQPIVIVREQEKKTRLKGNDARKNHILAARAVAKIMRTSLGPMGMDKILVSPDGDLTVSNDGATILEKMEVSNEIAKLLVDLSKSQDDEIGDGTTGVVILAGALLEGAGTLLSRGIHSLKISDGFDMACSVAIERLEEIAESIPIEGLVVKNETEEERISRIEGSTLFKVAKTALGSKVISGYKDLYARIAVDVILRLAEINRKEFNFDMLKIETKTGGDVSEIKLINGVLIDKGMSHPQMEKRFEDVKVALLTCPFEPPRPKTKHNLDLDTSEKFQQLQQYEKETFQKMINSLKSCGADFVFCQWGFDDEANHLLMMNKLPAVRWVGGMDVEHIAISTGARIVPRFEDLAPEKLGKAKLISEISFGTNSSEKMLAIEQPMSSVFNTVTVLIRGGNQMIVDEAKRSFHDALCAAHNLVKDNRIVYGGGAAEIACAIAVEKAADKTTLVEQQAMHVFASALETIPLALAENSALPAIDMLAALRSAQITKNNPRIGVDCLQKGTTDMKQQFVIDSLIAKRHQILLATQFAKIILKIDDLIIQDEESRD